ncbi:hypothetical protein CAPN002_23340 [Capnocytophaga stomatis]|uniref:helix-turn-helix transcriptional regulator n=1 Tax=Capnocytophaga stomatis TaxID=1848904 RepID=UPI00194E13D2|nr:helix-turn-helix transcriptional regulator [Capnocytophaga stomatis]GIJ95116.1 hypothetical protein CAPN002_23340 [Capnocytophaga stomatis]
MDKISTIKENILHFIDFKGIKKEEFYNKTGISSSNFKGINKKSEIGGDKIVKILTEYPEINANWLITGEGEMLKTFSKKNEEVESVEKPNVKNTPHFESVEKSVGKSVENQMYKKGNTFDKTTGKRPPLTPEKAQELQDIASGAFWAQKPKLIPVYGVSTIGGTNIGTDMSPVSEPEGYIEAGGWFPSVTAAIYHYGDSMEEYPAGVLLALQEVYNRRNIIWGSNYVIETSEMRITKRLQTCPDDKSYVMAYSSNKETYPDGRLVHEPITIHKEDITRLFLVIGVIKKEQMSAPILIKPSKGHKEL